MKHILYEAFCCAIFALVAITLHGCTNYDVEIDYTCSDYDAADKVCKGWKQVGKMSSAPACFPANATVITPFGPKLMSEIMLGDLLLGMDETSGRVEFSAVRAWLHRSINEAGNMLQIRTDTGDVIASEFHSIADENLEYTFARELKKGDTLVTPEGRAMVQSVRSGTGKGMYSPLTYSSNFFVGDGSNGFLAHSFAHVHQPKLVSKGLHAVFSFLELFTNSLHEVNADEHMYVHPICRLFLWMMGAPVGPSQISVDRHLGRRLKGGGNNKEQEGAPVVLMNQQFS